MDGKEEKVNKSSPEPFPCYVAQLRGSPFCDWSVVTIGKLGFSLSIQPSKWVH